MENDHQHYSSFVKLFVDMDIVAFEKFVNEQIPELLFDSADAPQLKDVKVIARKGGTVKVRAKDRAYYYLVPVAINVEKDITISNVSTDCMIILGMKTSFDFNDDWTLQTKTTIEKYEWKKKPVAKVGFISLPVESIILDNLMGNADLITGSIDKQIQEKLKIGEILNDAIAKIPNPVVAPYIGNIWWKAAQGKTYMDPLRMEDGRLKFCLGLKTDLELQIADQVTRQPLIINPPEFLEEELDKMGALTIKASISLDELNKVLGEQLLNKELSAAGQKLIVSRINISSENGRLVLAGQTSGGFSGNATVKALPAFDNSSKEVFLTKANLDLQGNDFLSKGIAMMLQSKATEIIEKGARFSLKKGVTQLNEKLNSIEVYPGIFLRVHLVDYSLTNFDVGEDVVNFTVKLDGIVALQIKKLPGLEEIVV